MPLSSSQKLYVDTARGDARAMVLVVCDSLEKFLRESQIESAEMAKARRDLLLAISAYRRGTHTVADIGIILRACAAAVELGYLER